MGTGLLFGRETRSRTFSYALKYKQAIREQLDQLRAADDYEEVVSIERVAVDRAERLEALYGHEKALQWYRKATATGETLKELQERWLGSSDYKESTKAGHRSAGGGAVQPDCGQG